MSEPRAGLAITAIIVAWNEAPLIADAVAHARTIADEVVVADAGSPDGTGRIAAEAGARVVQSAKARGIQARAGAEAAGGDVLLFLHADARLGGGAREAILLALGNPEVIGGGFYVRFLPRSWFTRLLEPANSLRRQMSRRYYGDTGIFVRAEVYRRLGGPKPWAVMHDYEFTGRMERAGRCAYIRHPAIWASARRFEGRELRTLLTWLLIQTLYRLGVPPRLLAKAYPDVRGDEARFLAEVRAKMGATP